MIFANALNNLKIKHKLVLLVAIPMLLLLVLALNYIHSEWNKSQTAQTSYKLRVYISAIVATVHELQLERGVSAGYLASNGVRFQEELQQQRGRTDNQVRLLEKLVSSDKFLLAKEYPVLRNKLEERWRIRSAVDELSLNSDYFRYYSSTNTVVLDQMDRLGRGMGDAHVARDIEAFNALLWLQEYVGRERAILTAVLFWQI